MRIVAAIIGALALLSITAFCLFGFAATFEPTSQPGVFLAFRIGYAVIGFACVAGVIALIVRCFKKQQGSRP
jgi:uncharacterized membrane protein YuzA (DUF378 family)